MPAPASRYPNYVLGVLFLVYVSNFIDRQILVMSTPAQSPAMAAAQCEALGSFGANSPNYGHV